MRDQIFDLSDQVVIITGGAGLIGEKFCEALYKYGANVIIADINYEKAMKLENNLGKRAKAYEVDITSVDSVQNMINHILAEHKGIDVLINNAYPRNENYGRKFEDIEIDDWKENVDIHLNGYFIITKLISEIMIKQNSGNIINLGSIYGVQGPNFNIYKGLDMTSPAEYSAIKGAVINFTKYLASYLGEYNIRVNTISPGGVFNNQDEKFVDNYIKNTPLNRMATPEDLQGAIVFLASNASKYVTGHNLIVDGGWTIC
ncbi:oxidoreductase [Halanaerobium congolense]|jgi:NAD(P)-dependent dehydrogenase (short-subunit alcohol dehydrogenase family)|uniref:oxidoreductase n=1 Tax=Halanaerobium congolense TaxID=54121 RepID=UPI0010623B08|nr:oxidoreductase [Halanaerobium congolense]TDP26386.1 NAD(P)-dependent dehydrogenase (short-subunit alcohol dehydrogenase family) [Halanaerobium congolense]